MIINAINAKRIGESLQKARESKGMTKQQLARAIKKRERYITNIEKGLNNNFNLEEICDILGVDANSLCERKPDESSTDGLNVADRIYLTSVYRNIPFRQLFKNIGITDSTIYGYKNKGIRIPDDIVRKISDELDVEYKWLSTGRGDNPLIPSDISELGNYLRMERVKQKLSQRQLANRCGWNSCGLITHAELHPEQCQNKTILNIIKGLKINSEILTKIDFGDIDKSPSYIDKTRLITYNTARRREVFAHRVREARNIKNMSQRELAAKLNCSQATISCIENNKGYESIISTKALADVLGTSEDWLWGGDSKPPLTDDDLKNNPIEVKPNTTKHKKQTSVKHKTTDDMNEDPRVISESLAKQMVSNEVIPYNTGVSENDFLLNSYGDDKPSVGFNNIHPNPSTDLFCDLIMGKLKRLKETDLIKVYDRIIELEKLDYYERTVNKDKND